ncbi:short-chain dehydrogenase [Mycolicibacterium canariasense]|uniref:Short-chain dehydrogenase n=1 Tax=Mycolicibacterium canariasense TaxID=228230 RepID=A0A100W960_MYCCR|nr:SDR family oxidoreductase [Mycolicibacterium canariasense]GAS93835.1 short-chain dehydrogenase [Mycolicibacterium canariasense]
MNTTQLGAGVSITGAVAVVTGANRGLGRAYVAALLERGAARVYAGARNPDSVVVDDGRITAVALDITDAAAVSAAASTATDATIVINNAGLMLTSPFLSASDPDAARKEMDTNYFGTLAMARAFAPVLAANGGGALVNVLSVVSFYSLPFNASYCASKAAEWSLTNALRLEMRGAGTLVVGVHPGFIDTDMTATVSDDKIPPGEVAAQTLDAVQAGRPEVLTDAFTRTIKQTIPQHLQTLYPDVQQRWDAGANPWGDG